MPLRGESLGVHTVNSAVTVAKEPLFSENIYWLLILEYEQQKLVKKVIRGINIEGIRTSKHTNPETPALAKSSLH